MVVAALLAADGSAQPRPALAEPELFDRLPRDRDDRAVLAALREIDPCALLAAGPDVPGLALRRTGPHRCELAAGPGDSRVAVELGESFEHVSRYHNHRLTVGGVKAYSSGGSSSCKVRLPVSFRRAISFDVRLWNGPEISVCPLAREFATAAVPVLDTARGTGPLQRWDACSLLVAALGDEAGGYDLSVGIVDIDSCPARVRGSQEKAFDLTLDFGSAAYSASMASDGGPPPDGRPVRLVHSPHRCAAAWTVDGTVAPDRVLLVTSRDCARTERLMRSVRTALTSPRQPIAPQRPLPYRPDEPDSPQQGACVDYPTDDLSCRPYVEGPTPAGRVDLRADPSTVCGIVVGPIGRQFPNLSPIVANDCVFVEPHHAVELTITAKPGAELRSERYAHDQPVALANHPGLLTIDPPRFTFVSIDLQVPGGVLHGKLTNLSTQDLTPALLTAFTEIASTYFT